MVNYHGKLVAGVNSKVQMYKWVTPDQASSSSSSTAVPAAPKLVPECSWNCGVVVLQLKTRGEYLVVADLMRSLALLTYRPATATLEEVAHDYGAHWMTACDMLSEDLLIGAETKNNLFLLTRDHEAIAEEDRARLDHCAHFHTGEMINQIRPGSLVMSLPDTDNPHRLMPSHILASASGWLGVLASLTKPQFQWLAKLEEALEKLVPGVGGFSHREWRAFVTNDGKVEERSFGFIDGDLIETVLDLPPAKLEQLSKIMDTPADEIVRRIEEAARVH